MNATRPSFIGLRCQGVGAATLTAMGRGAGRAGLVVGACGCGVGAALGEGAGAGLGGVAGFEYGAKAWGGSVGLAAGEAT